MSADGYELIGAVGCGTSFSVTLETADKVRVTWVHQTLAGGAGSCTHIQAAARLAKPLGSRIVEDGATFQRVPVTRATS